MQQHLSQDNPSHHENVESCLQLSGSSHLDSFLNKRNDQLLLNSMAVCSPQAY